MNSPKKCDTNSIEFKRELIMQVKKHPSIWSNCYQHEKKNAWKTIEEEMGYSEKVKLSFHWWKLRKKYFREMFLRTIERNLEAPDCIFFHDLSFLYEVVKETIQKKLGGISPPLFKPKQNPNGSQNLRCPCCLHVEPDLPSEPDMSLVNEKQSNDFGSIITAASNTSPENYNQIIPGSDNSVDSEKVHSKSPSEVEENVNQFCSSTNSTEHQQNDTENSLPQSSSSELIKDKTIEVIDLMDDSETTISVHSNDSNGTCNSNTQPKMTTLDLRALERLKIIEAVKANPETYLYEQKKNNQYRKAWQNVVKAVGLTPKSIKNRWKWIKLRYLKELMYELYSLGTHKSSWECFDLLEFLRPYMQEEIVEVHKTRIEMQELIKKRAEQESINNVKSTPQLNEPVLEDRTNEIFGIKDQIDQPQFHNNDKSNGDHDKSDQTIKIVSVETLKQVKTYSKKSQQIGLDENNLPILQNGPIDKSTIRRSLDLTNDDESNDNAEASPLVKKIRKSTGSDKNETNVLENKSLKRLPEPPALDLTNDDDEAESKDNAEAPPPTKKSRKSTGSEKNKTNLHANETPKRLPSPATSSLTPHLTAAAADEATKESATTVPSPKVFPSLDLTLDDDLPVVVTKPALQKYCSSKFQQAFVDELVNTNKIFPTFDLTTDEDKDQDKNANNENKIASISESGNEKVNENVIFLDDDDSVSSYEEVIVYFSQDQENKN